MTYDWEQRKVKDIAENTYGGGTPQTSIDSFWNGEIPWIQSQDIIENQLFNVEPRKHISEEAISKSATKLVPKNSIAIVTRVGVGKLAFMPFSYCTSQDFLSLSGIQIDEKYATYSIYQMLQKEKQNVQGTSIKGITIEEMLSKKIEVPCDSAEQKAIGVFFHNLDSLITLHQRKCEILKKIKKSLLKKFFRKNEVNFHKFRLKHYTYAWEQRKLSEIADKAVDNRGKTPPISEDGTHPLIEVACLGSGAPDYSKVTKFLDDETFDTALRDYIKDGDILFSTVGSIGLVSLMDTVENAAIAQNIVSFRAKENYDSKFLYAMFSNDENQNKAQRIVMGAVQPSIKVSQLVEVEYCVPDNLSEQKKIGEYFIQLDRLITLHQRK